MRTYVRLGLLLAVIVAVTLASFDPGSGAATGGNSITSPDTAGDVGQWTSLALDASGYPVVSYYDVTNGDLKVLHCGNANCTSGNSITAPDTAGDVGRIGTSLALDATGNPVVSYMDYTNGYLKVLHCNDPDCSGGEVSITAPDTAGSVGLFKSLALDASGNPVVSYYDRKMPNVYLKVLHCNDADCSGGDESITTPDSGPQWISLALDASGYPVVSYGFDLKVLHCNDTDCSGGDESITSPDTGGSVGYTSLALDGSGNPVISYVGGNFDLKVLHCNDADCAGGNESIQSPDTVGDVGAFTSLALDTSGNPVVSYYDETNGNLKVLHCGNPNCVEPVGGIAELPEVSDSAGRNSVALAGLAAAALVALGAGGWYARRRWLG